MPARNIFKEIPAQVPVKNLDGIRGKLSEKIEENQEEFREKILGEILQKPWRKNHGWKSGGVLGGISGKTQGEIPEETVTGIPEMVLWELRNDYKEETWEVSRTNNQEFLEKKVMAFPVSCT